MAPDDSAPAPPRPDTRARRIPKACSQCRARKQRCEGPSGANRRSACPRCVSLRYACSFASPGDDNDGNPDEPRALGRAATRKIEELQLRVAQQETRLADLESLTRELADERDQRRQDEFSAPAADPRRHDDRNKGLPGETSGASGPTLHRSRPAAAAATTLDSLDLDTPMSTLNRLGVRDEADEITADEPISLGLLSLEEAQRCFDIFWGHCHAWAPVLCPATQRSAHAVRTQCTTLFTIVCAVTLRFNKTSSSPPARDRGTSLLGIVDRCLGRLLLNPTRADVTLNHIRSMLLYIQWMPVEVGTSARYNDVSAWSMLGMAIRYALFLGLHRDAVAPFQQQQQQQQQHSSENGSAVATAAASQPTHEDVGRLRVWINLLTCDANLMLSSGLPASLNPEPVVAIARDFASHENASRPDDTRVAAVSELVDILKRASRSSGSNNVRCLDPASLRRANDDFAAWEAAWNPVLGPHVQHSQMPFTTLRAYRLAVNSACLAPLLSSSPSSSSSSSSSSSPETILQALHALDVSLVAAAQTLYALSAQTSYATWAAMTSSSMAALPGPETPLTPSPDAVGRLAYAVDSSWITHSFAAVFLAFCYARGLVDDDLNMLALNSLTSSSSSSSSTPYKHADGGTKSSAGPCRLPDRPRAGSRLSRLLVLMSEVLATVSDRLPATHPAADQRAILLHVMKTVLGQQPLPFEEDHGTMTTTAQPAPLSTWAMPDSEEAPMIGGFDDDLGALLHSISNPTDSMNWSAWNPS